MILCSVFREGKLKLNTLNLDYFLPPIEDKEFSQYKILALLKEYSNQFRQNKLYPALSYLNQIDNLLDSLYIKYQDFNSALFDGLKQPGNKIPDITIVGKDSNKVNNNAAFELINWAKPFVQSAMDEGIAIYEFVYDNIIIEPAGAEPSYNSDGYFIIPDYYSGKLLLVEYSCSIFSSSNAPIKSLKTKRIKQVTLDNINSSIINVGFELIYRYGDLVNPAVYICRTELDFPFTETVFPIAKSKLLSLLTTDR